ncbi:alpha-galactosidase [Mesorhizobium hungaricum]|jgi:alpha-galactosidase|uniref:alpha-galactosidase n=1 Tax=Mesorhizobium hungaricum TaxID=1566387 RepID=A0A1C2E754_9HYPH|nr:MULTISPECIES: alpha-galactosidase [Mesorhizobium]MBN9237324.1 alpha-galactosidase [Mesorhizobium sp.]MDQ0333250.1 alpha-galactosidase [Mesorhizobium sp. YL-MeA3-2017]OCX22831.1 alpha-galactosidase [Mesorhizobium hungaricum]
MRRLVSIGNERLSLVLALQDEGMPEMVYFGPGCPGEEISLSAERASRINGMDVSVPSAVLLPVGGLGFFGWPALAGHRNGRDFLLNFQDWQVEHTTMGVVLRGLDRVAAIAVAFELAIHDCGVVATAVTVTNHGTETYTLDRCMAATMAVGDGPAVLTSLSGMWGREFRLSSEPLGRSLWMQESRRGRTSHDRFPGLFLTTGRTTYAIHVGASGNHQLAVDLIDDGRRLVHGGELFEPGEVLLEAGQSYHSPQAYLTASFDGVACAASRLRAVVDEAILDWPDAKAPPRPVTLNTWEGSYFDHRLDALKAQAEVAAELGVERFVLDDGWFGRRDDDTSSLGDWSVDHRKYPSGLEPLIDHVIGLGMEFGLWFEPEMVSPDSDLYRAHPDWALGIAGRPRPLSRQQLVLDLTRQEVSDYLFDRIDAMLGAHRISYVKWDMNRDLTNAGGFDGRAVTASQTRAVHALMDRVRKRHPAVEIESCASGGGRANYGVLRHTHRIWTSDCTDALERLEIQRGATHFFPPSILGAHISGSPNHQTGRRHSLAFRAVVALAYHLGVELDPLTLAPDKRRELAQWIALHKRLRPLLHASRASFAGNPVDGRYVWGAALPDRIALFVAQGPTMLAEQPPPLQVAVPQATARRWRIAAVHPAAPAFVRLSAGQQALLAGESDFSLDTLRHAGLALPMLRPESGVILEIEPV